MGFHESGSRLQISQCAFSQDRGLESPPTIQNVSDFLIGDKTPKLTRVAVASRPCPLGCELCRAACTGRAAKCSECSGNAWSCSPARSWLQTRLDLETANKYPLLLFPSFQKHCSKRVKNWFREAGVQWGSSALGSPFWCCDLMSCPSVLLALPISPCAPGLFHISSWQSGWCQGAPRSQPGGSHRPRCSLGVGTTNVHRTVAKKVHSQLTLMQPSLSDLRFH